MGEIDRLIDRLHRVPRRREDYTLGSRIAARQFGLSEDVLAELRKAGMACGDEPGQQAYAEYDLYYLGLHLRRALIYLSAIGLWRETLDRMVQAPVTEVRITRIPRPEAAFGERPQEIADELSGTLSSAWPAIPEDLAAMLDDVARLDFCMMPRRVWGDTALAVRVGLVECWTAACLIVDRVRASGRGARVAHGLMVALPYSTPHTWAEIQVDGCWTPVDPIIITLMCRFGGLDAHAWPAHRSLGPLLLRLAVVPTPVVIPTRSEASARATFLTQLVEP